MKRAADISNSQLHSETEATTNDLSILRKPIKTSVTGWNEARKAYDDGTDEVRKLLSNECDIIYECKICRNMFRSLANFISHKRIYCKSAYNSQLHFNFYNDANGNSFSNDISTIVQAEGNFIGNVRNGKHNGKDLSSIVERLVKREKASRVMKLSDFYEQVNNKLTKDEFVQKRYVLQMDTVPESNVAVYQTVKNADDKGDTIKNEVIEVNELMDKSRTVLGPDGKIVDPADLPKFGDEDDRQAQPFECEKCISKFATEKTLKLHIETKHIPSTYVFQCPSCSKTFLQVGQVIRHLTNDHKKSMRRVRLMRDSILKRRTRIDEVPVKGPNRELARLQSDKEIADSQNKAWIDNFEDSKCIANICIFCNRRFERKAVLLSHQKVCQLKKKSSSRISLSRKIDQTKTNGWNDRDFDDSSNSNSLDAPYLDESSKSTAKSEKEKSTKVEKSIKAEIEDTLDPITTTNKRKRNRAVKAVIIENANDTDDEKSLNVCWNIDESTKIKEESVSPGNVPDVSTANNNVNTNNSWNIDDSEAPIDESVSNEKKTRSTSGTKTRPKLTSSHCKYCFKKFSNPSNLRRHITMTHSVPQKFTCNLCKVDEFRARRKTDMINHMRTKHQFGGERAEAFKFVTINDEPSPKQPPSINRRKERHTEVLQDDEEEIFIESEPFVPANDEEPIDNQQLNDTSNENSNIETDDASGINEQLDDKRKSRTRAKEKLKKLERTLSFGDKKSIETLPARRPVRNRTMPVKKDFVYDLSTLLKKDYKDFQHEFPKQTLTQLTPQQPTIQHKSRPASPTPAESRPNRRRNTLPDASDQQTQPQTIETDETVKDESNSMAKGETNKQAQPSQTVTLPQPKDETITVNQTTVEQNYIKGAAVAMAKQAVKANRAVFFKAPDLPAERPITAPVATAPQRQFDATSMKDWPILKRPPAIFDESKSKISIIKVPGLKRKKRSCLLKNVANNQKSLLHRNRLHELKNSMNGHTDKHISKCNNDSDSNSKNDASIKISAKLADKIQMQCTQNDCKTVDLNTLTCKDLSSSDPLINAAAAPDAAPDAAPAAAASLLANKLDSSLETISVSSSVTTTISVATTVATATPRRMTLLERLAENKTKKLNESLSRMTIGNSDNDSDENSD